MRLQRQENFPEGEDRQEIFPEGEDRQEIFPEGEDRQEIFPPEVTGTHKEIFVWATLPPEVTGSHKEIFAWAIDTCFFVSIRHSVWEIAQRRLC